MGGKVSGFGLGERVGAGCGSVAIGASFSIASASSHFGFLIEFIISLPLDEARGELPGGVGLRKARKAPSGRQPHPSGFPCCGLPARHG